MASYYSRFRTSLIFILTLIVVILVLSQHNYVYSKAIAIEQRAQNHCSVGFIFIWHKKSRQYTSLLGRVGGATCITSLSVLTTRVIHGRVGGATCITSLSVLTTRVIHGRVGGATCIFGISDMHIVWVIDTCNCTLCQVIPLYSPSALYNWSHLCDTIMLLTFLRLGLSGYDFT